MAEEFSLEPMDAAFLGIESVVTLEEKSVLDDLLESVDYEMQHKSNLLMKPRDLTLGTLNESPSIASSQFELDIEQVSRIPIGPFRVGHQVPRRPGEDEMFLEALCVDDCFPHSSNPKRQNQIIDLPEVNAFIPQTPTIPELAEEDKDFLDMLINSDNCQPKIQNGDTQCKDPLPNDGGCSRARKGIIHGSSHLSQHSPQQCIKSKSIIDTTTSKAGLASGSHPLEADMDMDLVNSFDANPQEVGETPHVSVSEAPLGSDLKMRLPNLAPYDFMFSINGVSRAEMASKALQELERNVSWCTYGINSESDMNWTPFESNQVNSRLQESIIDDHGYHLKLISPPTGVVQSSQLLFKEPGLRTLDQDEYTEDELDADEQLADLVTGLSKSHVPQKRPMIDELLADLPLREQWSLTKIDSREAEPSSKSLKVPFNRAFSASNALEAFLDLRGGRFKRVKSPTQQFTANEIPNDPIQTQSQDSTSFNNCQSSDRGCHPVTNTIPVVQVPATPVQTSSWNKKRFVLPELKPLSWKKSIMVKTALLKTHRSLFAFLERQGGIQLEVIYREMNSANNISVTNVEHPEVILNPNSCLIYTNIQALSQKNLPGQESTFSANTVRRRVQALTQDYDHVFVIVTVSTTLDGFLQSHIDTMSSFTGYCTTFKLASVNPIWAISTNDSIKTEDAVRAWTWSLIYHHGFPTSQGARNTHREQMPAALIHDETSWEYFLRRAGMNPMAAQVMLGMLPKTTSSGEEHIEETWGLSRLVRMSRHQRTDMFEAIVGSRTIQRLNSVLDDEWLEK